MMKNRITSLSLILIVLLFQACQQSPTQVGTIDENSSISEQQNDLDRKKTIFDDLEGLDTPDECLEDPTDPFNVILDCEGPGGGSPGGANGIATGFHYTHIGSNERIYHARSSDGITWLNNNYTDVTTSSNSKTDRGPATVFFKDELYSFYKGENSDEISFTKTSNGVTWSPHYSLSASLPGGSVYKSQYTPAAVVYRDTLYVYYARNSNIWGLYTADGINWSNTGRLIQDGEVENCSTITIIVDCFKPFAQFGATVYNNQIVLMFPSAADGGKLKVRRSSNGKAFFQNFSLFPAIEPDKNKGVSGVEFNGKLFMTFGGRYTSNVKIVETDLITANQRDITVGQGTARTSQTPSIATDGNKLVVVYKGNSGQNIFKAYSNNGITWMGNTYAVGGSNNNAGPSLIYVNN